MSGDRPEQVSEEILDEVRRFHAAVDVMVAELVERLPGPMVCGPGCSDCCIDDLKVFPVEAELIRTHAPALLSADVPHPPGKCAFLDESGSCRVYPCRPYVCRTQGLPLRWLEDGADGEVAELRDICPLNDDALQAMGSPLEGLAADQCWSLGDFESRLAGLQASLSGFSVELPRISLRSLFKAPDRQ